MQISQDIFTEAETDDDTLAHLGPLRPLAGRWAGTVGTDTHPAADGSESDPYSETFVLQPIDAQANGPQALYGLRYHQHVLKPDEAATFHDQVGYLLWEPVTGLITMSLAIPRSQAALAGGYAEPDAREFTLTATRGRTDFGISSGPFLEQAFTTESWQITFFIDSEDQWRYEQTTTLLVHGKEPFAHTDRNTLVRTGAAEPNPLAAGQG